MTQGTWRGRAQQILALHQKVNELTDKIASIQESKQLINTEVEILIIINLNFSLIKKIYNFYYFILANDSSHSTKSSVPASTIVAAEARANHARERSEAVARMQNTIQENQEELKELKSRFEASKARCRVLESEQNTLRQRLSAMLEKEQHDQQLISALTVIIYN